MNISAPQQAWMAGEEYGATGVIATPTDCIRMLQGLIDGELVSAASLQEMRRWITGSGSSEPDYGLGLCYWGYGGKAQFGHDGDGIGATSAVMYFPASGTYLMTAANATTEFDGRIAKLLFEYRNELGEYLASF